MTYYQAPWGRSLTLISSVVTLLLLVIVASIYFNASGTGLLYCLLPLAILAGSLLFTIRGYSVGRDEILIHRPFWIKHISLVQLKQAEVKPGIMHGSIRLFANGGLFSFAGYFRNRSLGIYRAYVSHQSLTVLLTFDHSYLVVSPADPDAFVRALHSVIKLDAH